MAFLASAGQSGTIARARHLCLLLVLVLTLASAGCASVDQSADDQLNTYQTTPETPGDDHGWGTNISTGGGH